MKYDEIGEGAGGATIEQEVFGSEFEGNSGANIPEKEGITLDFSFLKTPTGDGEISNYTTHPLNIGKNEEEKEGFGQILRGLSGFAGHDFKLAIIDILIGSYKFFRAKKGVA